MTVQAVGMAGPFALFFVPKSQGGGAGGQAAKDALGNDVKVRVYVGRKKVVMPREVTWSGVHRGTTAGQCLSACVLAWWLVS